MLERSPTSAAPRKVRNRAVRPCRRPRFAERAVAGWFCVYSVASSIRMNLSTAGRMSGLCSNCVACDLRSKCLAGAACLASDGRRVAVTLLSARRAVWARSGQVVRL
jgi:hypothetical protein